MQHILAHTLNIQKSCCCSCCCIYFYFIPDTNCGTKFKWKLSSSLCMPFNGWVLLSPRFSYFFFSFIFCFLYLLLHILFLQVYLRLSVYLYMCMFMCVHMAMFMCEQILRLSKQYLRFLLWIESTLNVNEFQCIIASVCMPICMYLCMCMHLKIKYTIHSYKPTYIHIVNLFSCRQESISKH